MDLIKQILELLNSDNLNKDELVSLINKLNDSFNSVKTERDNSIAKMNEAIKSRDKAKEILVLVKSKFGLSEDSELNEDKINSFIGKKNDDVSKVEQKYAEEMKQLSNEYKSKKQMLEDQIKKKDSEIKNKILDLEIYKIGGRFTPSENAFDDIIYNLKANATIEDGKLLFKNADGTTQRNKDGVIMTLEDKLDLLKKEKSFLFASDIQQSGGKNGNNGSGNHNFDGLSDIAKKIKARSGL